MFRSRCNWGILSIGLALLGGLAGCVAPAQPVTTVWQKLGIPQAFLATRDGLTNRSGNFPQCERKPPMLRIADPANLESPNAAIKAAAQVKAEEDLAPQKIKALKYLADIGCGCYDEDGKVKDAILAGLADCTPAVRMAAIQLVEATVGMCDDAELTSERRHCLHCGGHGCQLCQSERHEQRKNDKELKKLQKKKKEHKLKNLLCHHCLGRGCSQCESCQCCECNSAGCCGKEVQEKLKDMAYGVDDLGCFKEPVPEIREAAARALELCPCIPETPKVDEQKKQGVPEGAEEIPPAEGAGAEEDTTAQPTVTPPVAQGTPRPLNLPPDGTQIVSPEQAMRNAAYSGSPTSSTIPQAPAIVSSSSRRESEVSSNGVAEASSPSEAGEEMVSAVVEAIHPQARQIALLFTNELMIPPGEMLLVQLGNGEAQCQVIQSAPGRLAAQIIGHDYTRSPEVGETVHFGVLAQ